MLAYRPCKSEGPLTTYQQQLHHGYKTKNYTCLRTKFLQDLSKDIQKWTEEGEEIIVLADMNKDVVAKDIKQFCKDTNMTDAIAALHGNAPIPTHQQGSKAIDSIFISKTLLVEAKGSFLLLEKQP